MNPDIFKLIVVLAAILYFNIRVRRGIKPTNTRIINIGLCLLLFASALDFLDGFKSLNHFPIIGKKAPFHDILEDQFGDIPGLALFIWGTFREMMRRRE
jgi:hypothetical protein